jgi:hypothetical protein
MNGCHLKSTSYLQQTLPLRWDQYPHKSQYVLRLQAPPMAGKCHRESCRSVYRVGGINVANLRSLGAAGKSYVDGGCSGPRAAIWSRSLAAAVRSQG